ncbi:MAG TPA: benzoate-CoA ligase family protein [Casimicrobiaceae bacterium]|nr:benzoate-CoA ligase family protein [Casimicrobiaceae bacterium]
MNNSTAAYEAHLGARRSLSDFHAAKQVADTAVARRVVKRSVGLSSADHRTSPPAIAFPADYNAAHDLIERNLLAGRGAKTAYIDEAGAYSYADLAARVNRFAGALVGAGLRIEDRVLLCLSDTVDFPTAFLGSIKAGVVPIAVNTLLTANDYAYMLANSRARALVVSAQLLQTFAPLLPSLPHLAHVIVSRGEAGNHLAFDAFLARGSDAFDAAATCPDDVAFWLYSSGSTGMPKGTMHVHASLMQTAELYGRGVLGIGEDDVVFSAAKLFFAYGLGNALTFPLAVGATTVLMSERPTPAAVARRLVEHRPTIFYGVPTLYAALLASPELPARKDVALRVCVSAGEALPENIGKRWTSHYGVEILDGIGSTEMLHIFLSNRPGAVRYGSTGVPVPGYELKIVDDRMQPVSPGEVGDLYISGPTSATGYWNNRDKTRATFQGAWTKSGDKYTVDGGGVFTYAGRSDDMLKVSGIYVSPVEVESALITHAAVLEAAVVGREDNERLVKPAAYVVLKPGHEASPKLADELRAHVKSLLAPYKYPRWIEFIDELPKTATGKIQRFKLRSRDA